MSGDDDKSVAVLFSDIRDESYKIFLQLTHVIDIAAHAPRAVMTANVENIDRGIILRGKGMSQWVEIATVIAGSVKKDQNAVGF